jgi:spore maturation protein CgeB
VRIFILGKVASITNWLEDCAAALRAEGHEVRVGATRDPRVSVALETLALSPIIGSPMAAALARAVRRFAPDLILAIGAYHIPRAILSAVAAIPGRAPLVGWVGDRFDSGAAGSAALLDAVAYVDTALVAVHGSLGFAPGAFYLPHAVDPHIASSARERRPLMILIANPTDHRRAVVAGLTAPMVLHGPAWTAFPGVAHEIHRGRVPRANLAGLYAGHLAALNIRNERNVLDGLNQRSFEPCLHATPVVAEDQADLAACFEPGTEVLVWRTPAELDAVYARLRAEPAEAAAIGERGRRRVLADHTYARRLETILARL